MLKAYFWQRKEVFRQLLKKYYEDAPGNDFNR